MQFSIRFIVCSFGIASTATTAATFASEMTRLLFVVVQPVVGSSTDCCAARLCCSPSTGSFSAKGSKVRFWSQDFGERVTAITAASGAAFSTGRGTAAESSAARRCLAVRFALSLPLTTVIALSLSSKAFTAPS